MRHMIAVIWVGDLRGACFLHAPSTLFVPWYSSSLRCARDNVAHSRANVLDSGRIAPPDKRTRQTRWRQVKPPPHRGVYQAVGVYGEGIARVLGGARLPTPAW